MKKKNLTCVVCPNGCELEVTLDDNNEIIIEGKICKRGIEWAKQEMINPKRTIASSIAVSSGDWPLVSVRTKSAVSLKDIPAIMEVIKTLKVDTPVKVNDILIENVADSGSDIIATRNVLKV